MAMPMPPPPQMMAPPPQPQPMAPPQQPPQMMPPPQPMAPPPPPPPPLPLFRFKPNDGTVVGQHLAQIQGMTPSRPDEPTPTDIQSMLQGNLETPPPEEVPIPDTVLQDLVKDLGLMKA
jgi:hypothetical protein